MKTKLKIFAPLALFCLVLLVDKIALIPAIRDAGRRESTPMENIALNLGRLLEQEKTARDASPTTAAGDFFRVFAFRNVPGAASRRNPTRARS